jgi:hypothetical protein
MILCIKETEKTNGKVELQFESFKPLVMIIFSLNKLSIGRKGGKGNKYLPSGIFRGVRGDNSWK